MTRPQLGSWISMVLSSLLFFGVVLYSVEVGFGHPKDSPTATLYTYSTPENCVVGFSRVADGNAGNGFTRATTRHMTLEWAYGSNCLRTADKLPDKIKVRWLYYHRNDNHGWRLCRSIENVKNPTTTYEVSAFRDWNAKPCAKGFYRTDGRHHAIVSGDWKPSGSGPTSSPDHHFGS